MKLFFPSCICSTLLIGLLGGSSVSLGQLPVSRQAAALPVNVTGAGGVTPVGIPFTREPAARDVVASSSGQNITGGIGGYTQGAFNTGHVLLIVTGPGRGTALPITNNTASQVTVAGAVPALVNNSDEFEIVPLPTIGSVFGDSTTGGPFDLTGSPSAGGSDLIIINGIRYFYKTAGTNSPGWKLESAPNGVGDLGSTPISNLAGVNVLRRGVPKLVTVRGIARNTRALLPIGTGTSLLSWPFPVPVSLLASNLQASITGGPTAASADKVVINGVRYFFKNSGVNAPGWKLESAPNEAQPGQNNTVLNPGGRGFYILRAGAATNHPVLEQF